jgi:hypothetical protein
LIPSSAWRRTLPQVLRQKLWLLSDRVGAARGESRYGKTAYAVLHPQYSVVGRTEIPVTRPAKLQRSSPSCKCVVHGPSAIYPGGLKHVAALSNAARNRVRQRIVQQATRGRGRGGTWCHSPQIRKLRGVAHGWKRSVICHLRRSNLANRTCSGRFVSRDSRLQEIWYCDRSDDQYDRYHD